MEQCCKDCYEIEAESVHLRANSKKVGNENCELWDQVATLTHENAVLQSIIIRLGSELNEWEAAAKKHDGG